MKHVGSGEGRRRWFRKGGGTGADETPTVDVAARLALIEEHRHAVAAAKAGASAADPDPTDPAPADIDLSDSEPAGPDVPAEPAPVAETTSAAAAETASAAAAAADLSPEHLEAARLELARLMAEHRAAEEQRAAEESAVDADAVAVAVDLTETARAADPLPETPWWVAVDEDEAVVSQLDVAPEELDELVLVHQEPAEAAEAAPEPEEHPSWAVPPGSDPGVVASEPVVDLTEPAPAPDAPWYAGLRSDDDLPAAAEAAADDAVDLRETSDDPGDVLARLLRLREAGLLSAEEYEQERQALVERA